RAEVDPEAELIIGAITDSELDGKMRVSIVATSLDGQQPETKSVINMVHRIQNRNPGYSDFSNVGPTASFNFTTSSSSPVSHGANALKLENEVTSDMANQQAIKEEVNQVNHQYHEELLKNQEVENTIEETSNEQEISFTKEATSEENSTIEQEIKNDLSEFGVESDAPDLFSNDSDSLNSNELLSTDSDDEQEDDLEIPAFLRRQKN
ncbi:MAG: cell division protein FtsZ, partial [Candidatus Pelagibacter sp.]